MASAHEEDPGWGSVKARMLVFLVPGYLRFFSQKGGLRDGDALVMLRQLWLTFLSAIILFGVVVVFVVPGATERPAAPWAVAIVIGGLVSLAATWAIGRRRLQCQGESELATSYRTRFFLRMAVSESVALFAFVACFLAGHWWLYWIGAAFTLVGFWWNAPTRAHLLADQEELALAGCGQSLMRALRGSPGRPA